MKRFSAISSFRQKPADVKDVLDRIKKGDAALRNTFIQQYTSYIISMASKVSGRYIEVENDDEYTTALLAFNKAIDRYDPQREASFFTFAGLLIKRALYDLERSRKGKAEVSFSQLDEERTREELLASQAFQDQEDRFCLKQEIGIYAAMLKEFSLDFPLLARVSPKHQETRRRMMDLARRLSEDSEAAARILQTRTLPIQELVRTEGLSRKTLERHRRYILANFILLCSDLEYLKGYLKETWKGGGGCEGNGC